MLLLLFVSTRIFTHLRQGVTNNSAFTLICKCFTPGKSGWSQPARPKCKSSLSEKLNPTLGDLDECIAQIEATNLARHYKWMHLSQMVTTTWRCSSPTRWCLLVIVGSIKQHVVYWCPPKKNMGHSSADQQLGDSRRNPVRGISPLGSVMKFSILTLVVVAKELLELHPSVTCKVINWSLAGLTCPPFPRCNGILWDGWMMWRHFWTW